jgi:hypothetical protein
MLLRRFGRNPDFTPYLTERPLPTLAGLTLAGRETILIKATYGDPIAAQRTVNEIPCYGDRIRLPVQEAQARFTVRMPEFDRAEYATLRIGVSRPPSAGWDVAVSLNGKPLTVPLEQCAERLTEDNHEYASCKIIQVDPSVLKAVNTVSVSFPDGKPGSIGAAVIRIGVRGD